jgi:hypothetical protein
MIFTCSENPGLHNIVHLPQKSPAFDLLSKMLEYVTCSLLSSCNITINKYVDAFLLF